MIKHIPQPESVARQLSMHHGLGNSGLSVTGMTNECQSPEFLISFSPNPTKPFYQPPLLARFNFILLCSWNIEFLIVFLNLLLCS
jgi:hypothetical protein